MKSQHPSNPNNKNYKSGISFFSRLLFVFVFLSHFLIGQNLDYNKSSFVQYGDTGSMITPLLQVKNTSNNAVQIFVRRIQKNLPTNWTVCFCYLVCNPETLDTLRIDLSPGETVVVGNGFHSSAIPGTANVLLTVEEVGGTQKDTLTFTASSLASSVSESLTQTHISVYPNPANHEFYVKSNLTEELGIQILDVGSKEVSLHCAVINETIKIDTRTLPSGLYLLKITNTQYQTEIKKIIIQH